ncbi:MAG TPA: phosphopantetheine-binding protein, partial [Amycolatopsis sp.]|uniref:acyl carrier protein n=1 Tax=Amycolatopsis sp. TaxID=37632 RepID=UPI002B4A9EC7
HKPQNQRLHTGLAKLWTTGIPIRWTELLPPGTAELPTYPFQHTRYWLHSSTPQVDDVLADALRNEDLDKVTKLLGIATPEQREALASVLPAFATWHGREEPQEVPSPVLELDRAGLLDLITRQTADVLGDDFTEQPSPDRSLLDLGLSSFSLLELRNRLVTATGLMLPTSALLEHPTLDQLATHLTALLEGGTR